MPSPKRYAVYWTKTAASDLDSIVAYFAVEDIDAAEHALGKVRKTAGRLNLFPHRGRIVPELKEYGIVIYHEMICVPWRIIYRIEEKAVLILAVIDGRRNLEDLLLARFLQ